MSIRGVSAVKSSLDFLGLWKYGLGMIWPRTIALRRFIESGYLCRGNTLADLALKIGVDPVGLTSTVRAHNEYASTGIDKEFGKGSNAYDRANGDPANRPNPCLGPIDLPPYYAVAVVPTPLGTSLGLRTNACGEVLEASGHIIRGLYACGNDMHSSDGRRISRCWSSVGTRDDLRVPCGSTRRKRQLTTETGSCNLHHYFVDMTQP